MGGQKNNLSCRFKLELITTYHLWFFCENVVDVELLKLQGITINSELEELDRARMAILGPSVQDGLK